MTCVAESVNRYDDLSCNYGMRENPINPQKYPVNHRVGIRTTKKKSLRRCEECGKGFRYEKCMLNHRKVMHSEESMRRILFRSFSTVQKRKRSKRVFRCKTSPRFSVFSSSSSFPVSVDDAELLEVAESLILLSKSGPKFLNEQKLVGEALDSNLREFEDGFLRNEQKLVGEALDQKLVGIITESDVTSKFLSGFLGDKKAMKDDETVQQTQVGAVIIGAEVRFERFSLENRPGMMLQNPESGLNSDFQKNIEHQCRLCEKSFSTYQALGGHQTFHRMRKKLKSQTKRCREEIEAEINDSVKHKCRVCSRVFRSVQALRGHNKCHSKRTFGFNVNVSMVTGGIEL